MNHHAHIHIHHGFHTNLIDINGDVQMKRRIMMDDSLNLPCTHVVLFD
jgi:hypothetical protein